MSNQRTHSAPTGSADRKPGWRMREGLQIGDGLVRPVRILLLVQFRLRKHVVQLIDGHLIEGDHVLEFLQLQKEGE
ncbi:hypothetical protein ANANG_G00033920, partial [Anguilla anguilla]